MARKGKGGAKQNRFKAESMHSMERMESGKKMGKKRGKGRKSSR